jgi:hypothetical protein
VILAVVEASLLGIAAIATSVSGVLSTWYGFHKTNKEAKAAAEEECHKKLTAARKEGEEVAQELHDLKMKIARSE